MEWQNIFSTILCAVITILGFIVAYYRKSTKLQSKAAELINSAEDRFTDTSKSGGQRFEWVVDQLYGFIPAPIRVFIPRSIIAQGVQWTFDNMIAFAEKQLDKAAGKLDALKTE